MCWTEAIHSLLHTSSTTNEMRDALNNLHPACQRENELEESYHKRFNDVIHLWGNVHEDDEKMTLYVYGLSTTIHYIVARYVVIVTRPERAFKVLTHFASWEDKAARVRARQPLPYSNTSTTITRRAIFQLGTPAATDAVI